MPDQNSLEKAKKRIDRSWTLIKMNELTNIQLRESIEAIKKWIDNPNLKLEYKDSVEDSWKIDYTNNIVHKYYRIKEQKYRPYLPEELIKKLGETVTDKAGNGYVIHKIIFTYERETNVQIILEPTCPGMLYTATLKDLLDFTFLNGDKCGVVINE